MSLDEKLLGSLANWRPQKGQSDLLAQDDVSGWSLRLNAEANDVVGCRARELSLSRPAPAEDLRGWAERACARVKALQEPLKLLEVDGERQTAVLRSENPAERGETLSYYEVLLHGKGEAVLRRYQARRDGGKRESVPFAITHEALADVARDLAASA